MSRADLVLALPLVVLAGASLVALLGIAFSRRPYETAFAIAIAGLAAALACLSTAWHLAPRQVTPLLRLDGFARFSIGLSIAATLTVAAMSYPYFKARRDERGECYFLLLLACLGACVLSASSSFASLFLGLELLSTPLFALIGYRLDRPKGADAAFMYLVLAGVSSAFLLMGMALAYLDAGSLDLAAIAAAAASEPRPLLLVALGLMTVGVGFKLAVAPFHAWTPDVYDGAPAPVSAFIATVSKGAMAVLLVRFFAPAGIARVPDFAWIFAVLSGLSMFAGNLLALREDNIKRMLAFSSIAHLGYILVAFVASGPEAVSAVAFYLIAYFLASLGAFAAISGPSPGGEEPDRIEDYRGLASRRPVAAAALAASMLSLAGLPLTAGFMGKFLVFAAGAGAARWTLVILLAVNSTISLYYYLRVVSTMYGRPAEGAGRAALIGRPAVAVLVAMAAAVLALGLFPGGVMVFVRALSA